MLAGEILGGLLATPLGRVKYQIVFAATAAFVFCARMWADMTREDNALIIETCCL